jgi:hypothetical protein
VLLYEKAAQGGAAGERSRSRRISGPMAAGLLPEKTGKEKKMKNYYLYGSIEVKSQSITLTAETKKFTVECFKETNGNVVKHSIYVDKTNTNLTMHTEMKSEKVVFTENNGNEREIPDTERCVNEELVVK